MNLVAFYMVQCYRRQGKGHEGLTVPMLLGGVKIDNENTPFDPVSFDELSAFMRGVADGAPDNTIMRLYRCPAIKQPTLATIPRGYGYSSIGGSSLSSASGNGTTMFVESEFHPKQSLLIEAVTESLWQELKEPLEAGLLSYYRNAYRKFRREDIALVRQAQEIAARIRRQL
jgi:hypothetical protein